jgi:hypothetical protein
MRDGTFVFLSPNYEDVLHTYIQKQTIVDLNPGATVRCSWVISPAQLRNNATLGTPQL